jgi:antitoxin ParD1/3/4
MNVSLTPELEKLVEDKVATGMYQTASEVVREALRLLNARDAYRLEALRREVRAGFDEIDGGKFLEVDEQTAPRLAASVKRRGRSQLNKLRTKGRRPAST